MRKHGIHMLLCGAMIAVAVAIVATTGRPAALIPAAGCVLMMVVMMQMMGGGRQS